MKKNIRFIVGVLVGITLVLVSTLAYRYVPSLIISQNETPTQNSDESSPKLPNAEPSKAANVTATTEDKEENEVSDKESNPVSADVVHPVPTFSVPKTKSIECGDDFGDECLRLLVTCPDIQDIGARIRIAGTGKTGTIIFSSGDLSTQLYRIGDEAVGKNYSAYIMDELIADGFKTVEISWEKPGIWETPGGTISLVCRYAAVADYIYKNVHKGGYFMAQGNSSGSTQIAISLAYYGFGDRFDMVNLSSGPVPCPLVYSGVLNRREQDVCVGGNDAQDLSKEPFLSGKPQLSYKTRVNLFLGADEPTQALIDTANAYYQAIKSGKSMTTVPNTGHVLHQTLEGAQAQLDAISDFIR